MGFWWQPQSEEGVSRLLCEMVDESEVDVLQLSEFNLEAKTQSYRYPKAGHTNASVEFRVR